VDADRALDVLLEAGERALGLSAHDEAARHFAVALTLIREGRRPELLAHVLERLGESWEPVGETAAAIEVWTEALVERKRADDALGMARLRRRLGLAGRNLGEIDSARRHLIAGVESLRGLPPSEELVDLHHARLLVDSPLFDPDRAADTVAELSRLARVLGSPRSMIESLSGEEALHLGQGDYGLARVKAEEALRIAEQTDDWNLIQRAHRDLFWATWFVADHETCRRYCQALLELNRLGAPAQEPLYRLQFALLDLLSGPWDKVVEQLEEAIAQARRYGQPRIAIMALGTLALAHTLRGDLDRGEKHLGEARREGRITGGDRALHFIWLPEATLAFERGNAHAVKAVAAPLGLPAGRVLVGAAHVLTGDLEPALDTAEGLAAKGPPGSYPAALAARLSGLVEAARGNTTAAREHLGRSAAALAALRLPFEAAISQLHAGTGESVGQALATFEFLGAARYADHARRVLRSLGVRPPSPRRRREPEQPLSRRELEVARLVAERLTNAEIAERLVLSVRTVESHLDHIYDRIGISSRRALARWVTGSGEQAGIT
jgi:DNA-binding CsgD family transcriptional regulator/tetratricopeptide (TPR) repeat protein